MGRQSVIVPSGHDKRNDRIMNLAMVTFEADSKENPKMETIQTKEWSPRAQGNLE